MLKALYALLGAEDERGGDALPYADDDRYVALGMNDGGSAIMDGYEDEEMGLEAAEEQLMDYCAEYVRFYLERPAADCADLYVNVLNDPGRRGMAVILLGEDHPLVHALQMYGVRPLARINHHLVGAIQTHHSADVDEAAARMWERFTQLRPLAAEENSDSVGEGRAPEQPQTATTVEEERPQKSTEVKEGV